MIEYGIKYNEYNKNKDPLVGQDTPVLSCSFILDDSLYISDWRNNKIIIFNIMTDFKKIIKIEDWFPEWIQVYDANTIFYIDSKKNRIGKIVDEKIVIEKTLCLYEVLFITMTNHNTFLVGGRGEWSLLEYDIDLCIHKYILDSRYYVQSAMYFNNDSILICDRDRHQVLIINSNEEIIWSFGKKNYPGEKNDELSSPRYACCYRNRIYIADQKNNRVICLDEKENIVFVYSNDENNIKLWRPTCVQASNNKILITDGWNKRVIELDLIGFTSRQWGFPVTKSFLLNNPRGLEIINDNIYIADTYNHRIVCLDKNFNASVYYGGNRGELNNELFWPRALKYYKNGFFIADSRNSRIIKINKISGISEVINVNKDHEKYSMLDPHSIEIFDDKVLIVDSPFNKVFEIDMNGDVCWEYGIHDELKDPHQAKKMNNGNILITDTGNNRVLIVNPNKDILFVIDNTDCGALHNPRWAEDIDNDFLITDTDNSRILLVNHKGSVINSFGSNSSLSNNSVRAPRCAKKLNNDLIISDTYNNRIVKVENFFWT